MCMPARLSVFVCVVCVPACMCMCVCVCVCVCVVCFDVLYIII